jgi:NAD-dependent oxidoreductase involved in siderophore biosynthesis
MRRCARCGEELEARFRFCPSCGVPARAKLVGFFARHSDPSIASADALRVSRYLETEETPAQVRLSIWSEDRADAVVALDEAEAERLAQFLAPRPPPRRSLLEELRASLRG